MTRIKVHKGVTLFNFALLFYLFMDSLGEVSQSTGNVVLGIMVLGVLTMYSEVYGQALDDFSRYVRERIGSEPERSEVNDEH